MAFDRADGVMHGRLFANQQADRTEVGQCASGCEPQAKILDAGLLG